MLKLYYVANRTEEEDQDQFVVAHTPEQAEVLWQAHCEVPNLPDRVFQVPLMVAGKYTEARVLGWHTDVLQVGGAVEPTPPA